MNIDALTQAEHTADRIRSELYRTLDELDRRRRRAMDWRTQLRQHWPLLAGAGGVLIAAIAATIVLKREAQRRLPRHRIEKRVEAGKRAWRHPDRLAPARQSTPVDLGSKVLIALGSALATQLARRFAGRVVG